MKRFKTFNPTKPPAVANGTVIIIINGNTKLFNKIDKLKKTMTKATTIESDIAFHVCVNLSAVPDRFRDTPFNEASLPSP